jgi:hypothetical protein
LSSVHGQQETILAQSWIQQHAHPFVFRLSKELNQDFSHVEIGGRAQIAAMALTRFCFLP